MKDDKGMVVGNVCRVDEDGNHVPVSPEEQARATAALRQAVKDGRVTLGPGAQADLKRLGLSLDEVLSSMLGNDKH